MVRDSRSLGALKQTPDKNAITAPPDRMRWLRDDVLEQLAEPVGACGLIEPIVARPRKVGPYLAAVEI
jgi:hypothetical protein